MDKIGMDRIGHDIPAPWRSFGVPLRAFSLPFSKGRGLLWLWL